MKTKTGPNYDPSTLQDQTKTNTRRKQLLAAVLIKKPYFNENNADIENNANIVAIGEADETNLDTDYPLYKVEAKTMGDNDPARLAVLIKKDITYERLSIL